MSSSDRFRHGQAIPVHRRRLLSTLTAIPVVLGSTALTAQDETVFRGRERVTAIDLVVELEPTVGKQLRSNRVVPADPRPEDFTVLYGGRPQTVVAVEDTGGALDNAGGEPWELVAYLDAALSSRRGLRWAAGALAERVAELTAHGTVEVVLADPFPRTILASSRDRAAIQAELSRIAQLAEGRDEVVALRYALLRELAEIDDPAAAAQLATRAESEERHVVRRQLDGLVAWLTADARSAREGSPSGRRAIFLASSGWDLAPERFYAAARRPAAGALEPATPRPGDPPSADGSLAAASGELARTLAAYGWIVFDLALPPPQPPPGGVRVGKWLFRPAAPIVFEPDERYTQVDPADDATERYRLRRVVQVFLGGIRGSYREHRQPERAEAYLELGRALAAQGELADAEDALRRAVYHLAEDQKTAARIAEALIELGRVLDLQGRAGEARTAFETAYVFDGERTAAELGPSFALLDPQAPLTELARVTTGAVAGETEELAAAIGSLARRLRITYQVPGPPTVDLQEVEVRSKLGGLRCRVPGWGRTATPDAVAAARARRLLAAAGRPDDPPRGDLPLAVEPRPAAGSDATPRAPESSAVPPAEACAPENLCLALRLALPEPGLWEEDGDADFRLSFALGGPDSGEITVAHRRPAGAVDGRWWTATVEVPPSGDEEPWLAVVVENLATGDWGSRLVELADIDDLWTTGLRE